MRNDSQSPNANQPAVIQAELVPAKAVTGETMELILRVKMAPTWHIYAVGGSKGPGVATTLELTLPRGVEAEGEWACPEPTRGTDNQMTYEGTVEFRRRLKITNNRSEGPIDVFCDFGYQACDPFSCRLPTKAQLKATAEIVVSSPARKRGRS